MIIVDSQVHAYEANTPKRPWHSVPNWPDHVTGDEMVAAMDKVGVDGAIFISAFSMYQYDASYAVEVQRAQPDRMAIAKPVNPDDPAVADVIADWKKTPGTVGIRIMMTKEAGRDPADQVPVGGREAQADHRRRGPGGAAQPRRHGPARQRGVVEPAPLGGDQAGTDLDDDAPRMLDDRSAHRAARRRFCTASLASRTRRPLGQK